jgi:hypothetical protein
MLSVGEAERTLKAAKINNQGQRARLKSIKTKTQTAISAVYCHEISQACATGRAGKLWDDNGFEAFKFDRYCKESIVEHVRKPARIFRA